MSVSLQQTDTAMDCAAAAFCSGLSAPANTPVRQQGEEGGSAGSTEDSVLLNANESNVRSLFHEYVVPADYDGAAGDWTIRINVTTAGASCSVESVHVCRVDSGCTNQETLGSLSSTTSIATTGIKTFTVNQASGATFAAGDKVVVVFGLKNGDTMLSRAVGFTPDQITTAPGTVEAAASSPRGGRFVLDLI